MTDINKLTGPTPVQFDAVIEKVKKESIAGKMVFEDILNNPTQQYVIKEISFAGKDYKYNISGNIGSSSVHYCYSYKIIYSPISYNVDITRMFN